MKVLAIETSCDETGVAILEGLARGRATAEGEKSGESLTFRVLGSALLSQAALHAPYGGVYPTLAKREHEKNLSVMLEQAINDALEKLSEKKSSDLSVLGIQAIIVTNGPGLEPALWTGITFAQKLAEEQQLPLFGAHHMEGHLISSLARLESSKSQVSNSKEYVLENVQLPVLALLISGGHTEFVLMKDWFDYEIVGETLDDAVGECFDKVARLLGLPYPGGPEISKLADLSRKASQELASKKSSGEAEKLDEKWSGRAEGEEIRGPFSDNFSAKLPRPMLNSNTCDMSFSGLKTAALYALRGRELSDDQKAAFAREFEDAVGDVFVTKTRKALMETDARVFVIGGGVAANRYIRERLQALVLEEFPDIELRLPDISITGDNAVMIGEAALTHFLRSDWELSNPNSAELRAVGNLSIAR